MQTANDIQQVAANMLSDGKKGEDRPKPTLKPSESPAAPAKKVSEADEPAAKTKAGKRAWPAKSANPALA
jgi:pilus assembly protein CpaC